MTEQPTAARGVLTRGTVVIDSEACKGCDLCIDACPPRVLVMTTHDLNSRGYRYPTLIPGGCTGCKACSQICPDFVFQVRRFETPLLVAPDGTILDDTTGESTEAAR
jgi:2-oxoglutarate ferredoxin oxidoreductase subunit delta